MTLSRQFAHIDALASDSQGDSGIGAQARPATSRPGPGFRRGGVWGGSHGRSVSGRGRSSLRAGSLLLLSAVSLASSACLRIPEVGSEAPSEQAAPEVKAPPTEPKTAEEVLARYIEAIGGETKLRGLQQRVVEARLRFTTPPLDDEGRPCEPEVSEDEPNAADEDCKSREQVGQFVLYTTADGKLYRRMVAGDRIDERGFDGNIGWQLQADPAVLVIEDEAESLASREDAHLHWYFDYAARNIKPELLTPRELPATDQAAADWLDGISWQDSEGKLAARQLWFRRSDGMLVEEIERGQEGESELSRLITYSDFSEVDGVTIAHRTVQVTRGPGVEQSVDLTIQNVRHEAPSPDRFVMPTLPAPEPAVDERLKALESALAIARAEPDDATAVIDLARKAFAAAHFDLAAQAASKTLKIDSDEPEAMWILARVEGYRGNASKALKLLNQARRGGLGSAPAALQSAFVELDRGRWAKAAEAFQRAGQDELAERYENFEGTPYLTSGDCSTQLNLLPGSLPVIKAKLEDDEQEVSLLVDTGAADLILSKSVAQRLVLLTDARAPIVPGGPAVPHSQLSEVAFAGLKLKNVPAVIFPDATLADMADVTPIDGVIGLRAFRELQLTMEPAAGRLTFVRDTRSCRKALAAGRTGFELPVWVHQSQYVYFFAAMNGSEGLYLLNTGMRGAALAANEGAYLRAGIGAPPLQRGRVPMVEVAALRFGVVRGILETTQVGGAYGYMPQTESSDGFRMDGMLGVAALGGRDWTLDVGERRLYVRPSKAAAKPEASGDAGSSE